MDAMTEGIEGVEEMSVGGPHPISMLEVHSPIIYKRVRHAKGVGQRNHWGRYQEVPWGWL